VSGDTGSARRRSGAALAVGAGTLAAAWLFGSLALVPAGIGLLVAGAVAHGWRRVVGRAQRLEQRASATRLVEGERLEVELRLSRSARWVRAVATERIGDVATVGVRLRGGRGVAAVAALPRGRHELGPATVILEDPLGLERVELVAPATAAVLVRPRVVELDGLFVDRGRDGFDGRRPSVRRATGVDPHGVRDYQQGEPLRLVHWPTTARRGALSVVERQDAPREGTVVLLDCDPAGDIGMPGASSFDEAVRVTASILRARAARGREALLALGGGTTPVVRVSGLDGSWEVALDELAALRPDGRRSIATLLGHQLPRLGHLAEVIVVACRPEAVAGLDPRRVRGVVLVDAPTYAGRDPSGTPASLLCLGAAGMPVAVVRAGDDLAVALHGGALGARTA
jgi:uncharacterized protein (DUF58 family)